MTILLSFLLMLIIVSAMAVGVMFGRKPIAGSCGGMSNLGSDMQCEVCGGSPGACKEGDPRVTGADDLAVDATRGGRTL